MAVTVGTRAAGWWRAARSAGPRRLVYECLLALGVSAATTVGTLAGGHTSPLPALFIALSSLVLVPSRLVSPAGALLVAALVGAATNGLGSLLLFVLAVSAGYRMTSLPRAALAFGGVLACQVTQWALWNGADGSAFLLLQVAGFFIAVILPAVVAQVVSQRRQLIAAMHERNAYLRDQQVVVAERAEARERDRIARELHDSLGNRLTLMSLYAGALRTAPGATPEATVDLLWRTSAIAMAELRQVLGILRQSDRSDEEEASLSLDGLDELVDSARSTGTPIALHREGTPLSLPSLIEHAAYRTVQEGVTNALRHAGGATVRVTLRYEPGAVVVEVVNGPGAPHSTPTSGQGLIGLAERVRLAGGVLYHGREPDQGFRLAATLPTQTRAPEPRPEQAGTDVSPRLPPSAGRSRTWLVVVAVGAVLLVCGLGAGGVALALRGQTVSPQTYGALSVGQAESRVRAHLPAASAAVTDATGAPPAPPGTACVDYLAASSRLLSGGGLVYRFCFRDGTLVDKEAFTDGSR